MTSDRRTACDWLVLSISTGCGLGFSPVIPGTFGSLPAVAAAVIWQSQSTPTWALWGTLAVLFVVVIPLASLTEKILKKEDPGEVVIDEYVALGGVYAAVDLTTTNLLLGFVFFRVFDIWKPWPARQLDRLHGGLGIMADDLAAAVYTLLAILAVDAVI